MQADDIVCPAITNRTTRSRSLSDIGHTTETNDPPPSSSFCARKKPQRISANTRPVFPDLRPCIWPHLLRLDTKGNVGQAPNSLPW